MPQNERVFEVELPGGSRIRLDQNQTDQSRNGRWIAVVPWGLDEAGRAVALALGQANWLTLDYHYGPQDGYPSWKLTELVAKEVGGKPIFPKLPPHDPKTVY